MLKADAIADLKREVREIGEAHDLRADEAFVVWFLRAFVTGTQDRDDRTLQALTGGAGDKSIDAIYVDHEPSVVFIVQGKYHTSLTPRAEPRSDLVAFAHLSEAFSGTGEAFRHLEDRADVSMRKSLQKAHQYVRRGYKLDLQFVTTASVSQTHREEAEKAVRGNTVLTIVDRKRLITLTRDYMEGAAPPIPSVDFRVEGEEVFYRFDRVGRLSSWVFSMDGRELASLYDRYGVRLFARNVRGFLGMKTEVNSAMAQTLERQPVKFWYFNNGVTVVSDDAREVTEHGRKYLRVQNAQIINGQQTTRVLASLPALKKTSVLIKLLGIPRDEQSREYSALVSDLVEATNFQNKISPADLRSNDIEQIRIERELRKLGYVYLRKRVTPTEARAGLGRAKVRFVKKEELARAVGGCLLAPEIWRRGQRYLWEDSTYKQLFDGRPAAEYLTCYWLDRLVRACARGDARRGYAVYMILNFLWRSKVAPLKQKSARDRFRALAEIDGRRARTPAIRSFNTAMSALLSASLTFYRVSPSGLTEDGGRMDESSFFRRAGVEDEFADHWRSASNRQRPRFDAQLDKFFLRLSETKK